MKKFKDMKYLEKVDALEEIRELFEGFKFEDCRLQSYFGRLRYHLDRTIDTMSNKHTRDMMLEIMEEEYQRELQKRESSDV